MSIERDSIEWAVENTAIVRAAVDLGNKHWDKLDSNLQSFLISKFGEPKFKSFRIDISENIQSSLSCGKNEQILLAISQMPNYGGNFPLVINKSLLCFWLTSFSNNTRLISLELIASKSGGIIFPNVLYTPRYYPHADPPIGMDMSKIRFKNINPEDLENRVGFTEARLDRRHELSLVPNRDLFLWLYPNLIENLKANLKL